jgi:hypothetical protein
MDRWKYPSHKAAVVHGIPCCKTLLINKARLLLFFLRHGIKLCRYKIITNFPNILNLRYLFLRLCGMKLSVY